MKTFKRFSAILIAVFLMVSMMVIPASAAGEYTITINGTATGHTYEAYQIFQGTLSDSGVLSDIEWGTGVATGTDTNGDPTADTLLTALREDTTLGSYFTACTSAQMVAESLAVSPFTNPDSPQLDAFAKIVAKELVNGKENDTTTTSTYKISGLSAGYYLVKDKNDQSDAADGDSYTKYMLYVVKSTTISPKSDAPTITKQASKIEASGYDNSVSATVSRDVYFKLTGDLPENITNYPSYKYIFTDTLDSSLVLADNTADNNIDIDDFKMYVVNTSDSVTTPIDLTKFDQATESNIIPVYNKTTSGFTISFNDVIGTIKKVTGNDVKAKDTIVITYKTTLTATDDLVVTDGSDAGKVGNVNKIELTYSSNPNLGATGPVGKVSDTAEVFTYQLKVNKVDGTGNALSGAKFILFHDPSISADPTLYGVFTKTATGRYTLTSLSTTKSDATTLEPDDGGILILDGLGAATFELEETEAPVNYNKLEGTASVVMPDSRAAATQKTLTITNHMGSTLPETGGIGTTIFYGIGGVLVIGALSLLIVRKRSTAK